jgi:predicted GIY-YIG superfamily endonuclease
MTGNLYQRVMKHQNGTFGGYTSTRLPVKLVWYERFMDDPEQAISWEKQIKGWSRRKKKALIDGDWDSLILFSRNYTQYGNPEQMD